MTPPLCQNRPEGFGPHSALHPRLPTTCFLDVIVEPLATWIFLALMLALLPVRIVSFRRVRSWRFKPSEEEGGTEKGAITKGNRVLRRALSAIYYVLIVAMLAMQSLEIARSVAAELGIGLLPFTYVGVLVALAARLTWRARVARLANVLYWVMLVAVLSLKTAAEQEEQMGPDVRVKDQGVQGQYPTSDQVIDNAVMVGVAFFLALLEFNGFARLKWT